MDFAKTEEHSAVENLAQQIFRDQVGDDYLKQRARPFGEEPMAMDKALWQTIADAGLIGVASEEAYGGAGLGMLELCSVLEAQGAVLAGLPLYQTALTAQLLEAQASEAVKANYLGALLDGSGHAAIALTEMAREGLGGAPSTENGRLSAEYADVAYAEGATLIVLGLNHNGADAFYLLDPSKEECELILQQSSHRQRHALLSLNNVSIDNDRLLQAEHLSEWFLQRCFTALAALQLGVVEEALQRTAQYTMERQQFGKAIASFQSVSHRAANGYIDCTALRASVILAAWRLSENKNSPAQARTAKWWAAEAGHRIGHSAMHLHGGIGSDVDFPIHRYFRWAKQIEFTLGGAEEQLAHLGKMLAEDDSLGIEV